MIVPPRMSRSKYMRLVLFGQAMSKRVMGLGGKDLLALVQVWQVNLIEDAFAQSVELREARWVVGEHSHGGDLLRAAVHVLTAIRRRGYPPIGNNRVASRIGSSHNV